MNICIYGASSAELEQIYYEKTEELGRMMSKRGHGLVFGGGTTGMIFLQKPCASEKNSLRNVPMQQS